MATFLVRVELPDRPGALGAVASRIGSVRADVRAVEIVERRQGSAVDEFVVELADESRLSLLLSEIAEVDGVSVEEVHPLAGRPHDRRLDGYETAVRIMQERSPQNVLAALASRVAAELDAAWTAVVDVEQVLVVASHGRPPQAAWLAAHVSESRTRRDAATEGGSEKPESPAPSGGGRTSGARAGALGAGASEDAEEGTSAAAPSAEIGWVDLAAWDLVLMAGRPGLRFGAREQAHLAAVARLADARWVDLAEREARVSHPSCST